MQNNMSTLELPESIYKQAKIKVHCSTCGAEMIVTYKVYDRKRKHGDNKWTCRKCLGAEASARYKLKSPEEKAEQVKAMIAARRVQIDTMTDEQRAEIGAKLSKSIRRYNENRTEEQKQAASERCRKAQYKRWENASDEERHRVTANMIAASKRWRNSLSPEERKFRHDILQAGNVRWWQNAPEEEKNRIRKIRSLASKAFWDSLSDEDRKAEGDKRRVGIQAFWDNMSREEYEEWDKKRRDGLDAAARTKSENSLTNTEVELLDLLRTNGLNVTIRWYNHEKHPDFDLLFPKNPFTGESRISPYHQWDFRVHTLSKDYLIDIDGSVHDPLLVDDIITLPNGSKANLAEVVAYADSKRPYQTDGLPAYIVQCWDDNLTLETPVYSIKGDEFLRLKDFINMMLWTDLSSKEQHRSLKVLNK